MDVHPLAQEGKGCSPCSQSSQRWHSLRPSRAVHGLAMADSAFRRGRDGLFNLALGRGDSHAVAVSRRILGVWVRFVVIDM